MASKREAAKLIRLGAKKLERSRWIKNFTTDGHGGYCMIGSLDCAFSNEPDRGAIAYSIARKALDRVAFIKSGASLATTWNDSVARSKAEVLKFMRETARRLEHGLKVTV